MGFDLENKDYPVDSDGFMDIGVIQFEGEVDDDGFIDIDTLPNSQSQSHSQQPQHSTSFQAPPRGMSIRNPEYFSTEFQPASESEIWAGNDGDDDNSIVASIIQLQARLASSSSSSSNPISPPPPPEARLEIESWSDEDNDGNTLSDHESMESIMASVVQLQSSLVSSSSTNPLSPPPLPPAAPSFTIPNNPSSGLMFDPMSILRSVEEAERQAEEAALSDGCIRSLDDLPSLSSTFTCKPIDDDNLVKAGVVIPPHIRASHLAQAVAEKHEEELQDSPSASVNSANPEELEEDGIVEPTAYLDFGNDSESVDQAEAREALLSRLGSSLGDEMRSNFQEHLAKYASTSSHATLADSPPPESWRDYLRENSGILQARPAMMTAPSDTHMDDGAREAWREVQEQQEWSRDQFDRRSGFAVPDFDSDSD